MEMVWPVQDVVKESGVVLFVYPKADTSGCTKQVEIPHQVVGSFLYFGEARLQMHKALQRRA
jgi:hypothetical protein